jgi:hypothetical protein
MDNASRIALAFVIFQTGPVLAEGIMTPGGWESTMTVVARNLSTGEKRNMGDTRTTACLSKDFLASDPYLKASVNKDKSRLKGADCTIEDYRRDGAEAQWIMNCATRDGQSSRSRFHVTLSSKLATVTMNQVVTHGDKSLQIDSSIQHKHIGECTDDMPRM